MHCRLQLDEGQTSIEWLRLYEGCCETDSI